VWLLGGVATTRGEPSDPSAELQIAGVGPLVSLTLAGAFWLIAAGLGAVGIPAVAVDVFTWLAVINLVLAIFNLMPAAPLRDALDLHAVVSRHDRMRHLVRKQRHEEHDPRAETGGQVLDGLQAGEQRREPAGCQTERDQREDEQDAPVDVDCDARNATESDMCSHGTPLVVGDA
jgi:hypothetical protein